MQLGQLIFGRPGAGDKAYYEGQALGSQVLDRLAGARRARAAAMIDEDRLNGRAGITPQALQDAGYSVGEAPLLGSVLRSNDRISLSDLGQLAIPTAGADLAAASQAARSGDIGLENRLLTAAQGKPIKTTDLEDGLAYNPYGAPGQDVNVTPLGQAVIGQHNAQANAANAHARLFDTQAAAGGFSPRGGGPFGGDGGNSFTPDAQELLATASEQGFNIPIPSVGMGGSARVQFVNGLASDLKKKNIPLDLGLQEMRYGLTADPGIKKSQQLYSSTKTLEAGADALAQQAAQLSASVSRGQIPLFNAWVNAGRRATSDPDIARFDRAINAFTNDYAKVVSGALGSSAGTDSAIREAKQQLMASNSPEVFAANIDQMQREMHARTDGMLNSIRDQVANLANGGRAPGVASAAPPLGNVLRPAAPATPGLGAQVVGGASIPSTSPAAPAPAATSPPRAIDPKTGHAVVWNGSAWVPEQ